MEGMAVRGFIFSGIGIIALIRIEKLTKTLKEKGFLDEVYKD